MFKEDVMMPESWQALPQGELLKLLLERRLERWWPKLFGYHMLKIGALSTELRSEHCPIKHQVCMQEQGQRTGLSACAEAMPFQENSVDVALMANCLEYSRQPHQVIREAHRVVLPEGYIIISGFNPLSVYGMRHNNPFTIDDTLWRSELYRSSRIVDWLTVLGARVVSHERIFVRPPTSSANKLVQRWRAVSRRYLTRTAGMYLIIAQKQEMPMTPVKLKWQVNPALAAAKASSFKEVGEVAMRPCALPENKTEA